MLNLIFIYLLLLILVSRLEAKSATGRLIFLFRGFFPSWKFFDDIGDIPVLHYRILRDDQEVVPWTQVSFKSKRKLSQIFINADGNLKLAHQSLLQHLLTDLNDMKEGEDQNLSKLTSYRLVQRFVHQHLLHLFPVTSALVYQFKVSDVLISRSHPLIEDASK